MLAEGTLHKKYKISWRRSSEVQPQQSEVDQPQQEEDVCSSLSSRISDIAGVASCCRLRISDHGSDCCDPDEDSTNSSSHHTFSSSSCPSTTSSTRKSDRRRRRHPQLRPDTVKKVRVRTSVPARSPALVLISTSILLLLLCHLQPSCWAVLLDANGESAAGPAGGGGGGAPFGDGVGLSLGGNFNLEKSIAAVFSRVAYGSTTTTKRSIPDNVYVPSLTTVSTPLLTTFRYREKDKDPGMSLGGSGSGGGALGGSDLLGGPGLGPAGGGGAPHYNQQQISQNHRGYELDLERDHVLPTSAPNAEILKSNSNPTYPNPNRHHGHDRHRHSNSTPYPHGHPKKGFPTNPMFPGDIPSYSPPSRAFFTPPLPRNYTNPFADKPTLRGTNSDSTIINTNTYVNRRPLPPPSLMPGHERIPIRPDLNGSGGAPLAPKAEIQEPVLVTGPASSSQSIEAQRRKPLNTPSEKSNKLDGAKSYGVDSKFMLDGGGNSSAILPNGMHFPSISRILSGSNGRTQTIPDVLLRSVTSAPRPNQPTFDLNPELLLNLPLTFLTTTFAILILFLLLRSINHKTNRYSSILRPLTIMIGSGVHVGLCVTLHLVESYETQQFYHKQTQLLSRGGSAGHGPTNIQIPPRVLSLICQIIYIFICLSLGILYLYMYRLLKRILHKSQNYIHGYNNLSYAIHITIATALLFILLAALQIYGAISISSQTKVKLSPANMNDAAAAKKTLWASHIEIDWFQWGYQFSLRFIEIVIIALLSWVTGLKTGTSKGVPREKDMEQPNASGFALFPCTSSSSQENFETDYPAVCNANTNLHTYTLRTGKPIYDDNFALNSLNLEQNSAQDLQPNDFQRSIETNSMRSSSHNYSNNYNGSQQADQHDDFINDGEQMPDHYENPNFELKHHHRGEPGPQYHDIMDNCYSEPINAPPYDTKSLRGNPGPPPPQPMHSQQNSRNYDFQNFERPTFDQAASSQSISRGEFRASKNLKTLKSGQAAAAAAAGGYDGANTMGHHHYNHFNNYNDSFERRIGVRKSGTLNNIGHFNQHVGGGSGRNNNNSTSSASSSASSNNRAMQQGGRPPRGGAGHLNGAQTLGGGRGDHHHHHHHHPQAAPRNLPPSDFPVHPGSFNDRLGNGAGGSQDGINNFDDNSSSAASGGTGNYYHSKKRSRESSSSSYTGFNGNNGVNGGEHGPPNDGGSSSPTASGSNVPINGLGGGSSSGSSGVLPGKMGPPQQQQQQQTNGDNSSMLVAEQGFVRFRALEEPALGSQRTAHRDKNKLFMNS